MAFFVKSVCLVRSWMIAIERERAESTGNCGSEASGSAQTAEERCVPTKRPIPAKTASTWRGVGEPPWVYAQINTGSPRVDQVTAISPEASLPLLPVLSPAFGQAGAQPVVAGLAIQQPACETLAGIWRQYLPEYEAPQV